MIFPGMDPYLEDPQTWTGIHSRMIVYLADWLQPILRPRYLPAVEERAFVQGPQELEIHESYVEILDRQSGHRMVTVVEVLSPTNKFPGPGQGSYLAKQREVRASQAHLVEIDLLRAGHHVLAVPEWAARGAGSYHYLVCVNRAEGKRDQFELYPRTVRERLPRLRVPLAAGDRDVVLDLQAVLTQTYEAGSYRERLHYDRACVPPLAPVDQAWADQLLQAARPTNPDAPASPAS